MLLFLLEACETRSEPRPGYYGPFELSGYHSMAVSQVSANRATTFPDELSIIGRIDILEFFFRFCHCAHVKLEPLLRVLLSARGNFNGREVKQIQNKLMKVF